jgi:hypothetical protein
MSENQHSLATGAFYRTVRTGRSPRFIVTTVLFGLMGIFLCVMSIYVLFVDPHATRMELKGLFGGACALMAVFTLCLLTAIRNRSRVMEIREDGVLVHLCFYDWNQITSIQFERAPFSNRGHILVGLVEGAGQQYADPGMASETVAPGTGDVFVPRPFKNKIKLDGDQRLSPLEYERLANELQTFLPYRFPNVKVVP